MLQSQSSKHLHSAKVSENVISNSDCQKLCNLFVILFFNNESKSILKKQSFLNKLFSLTLNLRYQSSKHLHSAKVISNSDCQKLCNLFYLIFINGLKLWYQIWRSIMFSVTLKFTVFLYQTSIQWFNYWNVKKIYNTKKEKCIEIKCSAGSIIWLWCCLIQDRLPIKILMR